MIIENQSEIWGKKEKQKKHQKTGDQSQISRNPMNNSSLKNTANAGFMKRTQFGQRPNFCNHKKNNSIGRFM
jgi:hypothetical protein